MGKSSKRNIAEVEADTYESDDGFVSNDDGKAPKSKKTKKEKQPGRKEKDGSNNKFWTLSSGRTPRRVEISDFKDMKLINIREFYEKDDTYLPGKKGISLTVDQYSAFLRAIPEINASLKKAGIDVSGPAEEENDGESETERKPPKKIKAKKENIEATSDEED